MILLCLATVQSPCSVSLMAVDGCFHRFLNEHLCINIFFCHSIIKTYFLVDVVHSRLFSSAVLSVLAGFRIYPVTGHKQTATEYLQGTLLCCLFIDFEGWAFFIRLVPCHAVRIQMRKLLLDSACQDGRAV